MWLRISPQTSSPLLSCLGMSICQHPTFAALASILRQWSVLSRSSCHYITFPPLHNECFSFWISVLKFQLEWLTQWQRVQGEEFPPRRVLDAFIVTFNYGGRVDNVAEKINSTDHCEACITELLNESDVAEKRENNQPQSIIKVRFLGKEMSKPWKPFYGKRLWIILL